MAIDYKTMMVVSAGFCMLALTTSCWKHDGGLDVVASDGQSVAKEEKVKLLRSESYDKEFKRLVASSNMTVNATEVDVNRLCNDIDKTVDAEDAVQLFDLLGRMALSQPLVSDDYTRRPLSSLNIQRKLNFCKILFSAREVSDTPRQFALTSVSFEGPTHLAWRSPNPYIAICGLWLVAAGDGVWYKAR